MNWNLSLTSPGEPGELLSVELAQTESGRTKKADSRAPRYGTVPSIYLDTVNDHPRA